MAMLEEKHMLKGKMKMPEYSSKAGVLDWSESGTTRSDDRPQEARSEIQLLAESRNSIRV